MVLTLFTCDAGNFRRMRLISLLKKASPSLPRMEHPIFGQLEATLINEDGTYFWETSDPLLTSKGPICVYFDASADGPTDDQVVLWNWIYGNADTLAKSAEPLLLDRLRDFHLENHIRDLVWSAAGLSPDGDISGPWDMSFELRANHSAILTAYFVDGDPITVSFDD